MSLSELRFDNVRTGVRAHVVSADEVEGRSFVLEYTAPPGSPRELIVQHRHESWRERFEVLAGHARYRLGRAEADLAEGSAVEFPPGIAHLHPWNAGSTELRVRQTTTLLRPDPAAIRDTLHAFAMMAWLAREGKVDGRGRPSPLQAAVIQQALLRHGGSLAGLPVPLQRVMIDFLAALGRRRGYVACDPAALRA